MGSRSQKTRDKKKKTREYRVRKETERRAAREAARKIKDAAKMAENAVTKLDTAVETAQLTESHIDEVRQQTSEAGVGGVTSRIMILKDRSYEPPIHPKRGGPLMYEIYPGLFGQAVWMETYQQIWINHVEPVVGAWGAAIVDKFLDHLTHRCRVVHVQYGELYIKLYEKGWINEPVNLYDEYGVAMSTDRWRPPGDKDEKPHDGQGGPPEHIDL